MYTDEEKLDIVTGKITQRFAQIQTWDELKTLVRNITPTRMKNFIKNALQKQEDSEEFHIGFFTERKANTDLLETEVNDI